jgi:class 3 adenylate cyclase/CHASE2 domain-containing sensor protein
VRLNFLKSPPIVIAAVVVVVVCVLEITRVSFLQRLEWMTYDSRVKLAHQYHSQASNNATNLGLVAMSDASIAAVDSGKFGFRYGLYWPRQVYGRALEELSLQGAKAVAFDILFAEERLDQPPYLFTNGDSIPSDEYFAQQIEKSGNIILAADKDVFPASMFAGKALRVANIGTDRDIDGVLRREQPYVNYTNWHTKIKELDYEYDLDLSKTKIEPDKITFYPRHDHPVSLPMDTNGFIDDTNTGAYYKPYTPYRAWGLGVVLAAQELGLDLDHADIQTNQQRIVLKGANGITRVIPLDENGTFYIDWALTKDDPDLAVQDFGQLLSNPRDRANGISLDNYWSNKLVVVGSIATGNDLADMGVTPLENRTFLVSKHWNVANSIITGRFIKRTSLAIDLALIVLAGTASAWITWFSTKPVVSTVIVVLLAALYAGVAVLLFVEWRIWIPTIAPLLCSGFVTHLVAMTYRVRMEQHERKRVRAVFQRVVSPDIVSELLGAKSFSLSSRRELTIYFADVRGFTELSDLTQQRAEAYVLEHKLEGEAAEAFYDEQARDVLNTVSLYLATITNAIKGHRGTLDKYIGDCVMAFWGAPVLNPNHALDAVRAAIDAQRALAALNRQREAQNARRAEENAARVRLGLPPHQPLPILSMGSGINTGVAIAGLMGSENHISNYTVFGREVNLASRLEGVSGHGRIIIGEGTYVAIQKLDPGLALTCVELSPQKVKGFREPVRIYEVPWETGTSTGATAFIEKTAFIHKAASH